MKQEPGSTKVTNVREVTSMRLSTRFQYCLISLTSQCALLASRKASQASTLARSPCDLNTSIAVSSSLMRKCKIASSSSRATCSGQNDDPCAIMPSMSAGGALSAPLLEIVPTPPPPPIPPPTHPHPPPFP